MLNRDYKSLGAEAEHSPLRGKHLHLLAIASAVIGLIALFGPTDKAEATRQAAPATLHADAQARTQKVSLQLTQALSLPMKAQTETVNPTPTTAPWKSVTVKRGDTLSAIFSRLEISPSVMVAMLSAGKETHTLRQLFPGQKIQLWRNDKQQLQALHYTIDATKTLEIQRSDNGFQAHVQERPIETRVSTAHGTIDNSLFLAGQRAGLSDNIIMAMVNIFGWDIDFAHDVRGGDSFTLLYEQRYIDGEKLGDGDIVAAEFVNQGKTYRAVRFVDPKGNVNYYTPEGLSMRKAFLRSPVDFRRISSRFQAERLHPILGRRRPHMGVDFAAATGTPIKAAGDGKIIFRGWKGGYGHCIILAHGRGISTLYGHMSRFRGGLHTGSRVRQGQVIGYVGMSGLATGPHLHYEFRVNGVHRNPLTVKLPNAAPIKDAYKQAFEQQASQLVARLDLLKRTAVASNQR